MAISGRRIILILILTARTVLVPIQIFSMLCAGAAQIEALALVFAYYG
jgi:hypothetical protein